MNELTRAPIIDVEAVETSPRRGHSAFSDETAERAVLAAALLDGERAIKRIEAVLDAADFYDPKHALLWECFRAIHARGEPLDIMTAAAELRARDRINTIGGAAYLGELTDDMPITTHVEAHAALVVAAAQRRRLAAIGERLLFAARDPSRDPEKLRDACVEALRLLRFGRGAAASSAEDLVASLMADIEAAVTAPSSRPRALPFYVETLDRMSGGGMKRGGSYFIAARPGIGKTSLCCQVGGAVAEQGERVLYVALEPTRAEITQATVANRAGVDLVKLSRSPHLLTQGDIDDMTIAANAIAQWPLHVVDASERDVPDTVARIEAVMRSLPSLPSLVVIDHLLKLQPTRAHSKPHEGTAEVVAAIVALGKRTGSTMLTLCHIGRGVSTSSGLFRRPRAEDIAGGDAMNRDADGIIILHREDKYPTAKENVENPRICGVVDMLAPKLRGVPDNTLGRMRFRGEVQRFEPFVETPKPTAAWRDPDEDLDDESLRPTRGQRRSA